jgi:AraC family transcriptional regulator
MENPMEYLPASWTQLAQPSPWRGIYISHYLANSHDSGDFIAPTAIISLNRKAAGNYRLRTTGGRWKELDVYDGSLCFLPSGAELRVAWEGKTDAINIHVDMSWVAGLAGTLEIPMYECAVFGMQDKITCGLLQDIYRDNQLGAPRGLAYAEMLVVSMLMRLSALSIARPSGHKISADQVRMSRAVEFIHANYHGSIGVEAVSRAVGHDGDLPSFVRRFRRHTGKTPYRYLHDVRLDAAREMLCNGARSVTDVAIACGFANLSHFSDSFKRRWGCPASSLLHRRCG